MVPPSAPGRQGLYQGVPWVVVVIGEVLRTVRLWTLLGVTILVRQQRAQQAYTVFYTHTKM